MALVLAVLAAVNVLTWYGPPRTALLLGPPAALGLVLLARRAGLGWVDLGLDRASWRRGVCWAAAAGGAGVVAYAVAVAVPALRAGFRDTRYHQDAAGALFTALVVVPVGTVLFEEVAFRGVLWGWLRRDHGTRVATAWSSVLFGLWHVLPSRELGRTNQEVAALTGHGGGGQPPGAGAVAGTVAGAVVFTCLSGVLLCELRRRGGSLLAPAGLHWAVNGLGVLAAAAVWAAGRPEVPR